MTIFILTDVKSGSERLRRVPRDTQLERDGVWIQTQATPLSRMVGTVFPAPLPMERAWRGAAAGSLPLGSQCYPALGSMSRGWSCGRAGRLGCECEQ